MTLTKPTEATDRGHLIGLDRIDRQRRRLLTLLLLPRQILRPLSLSPTEFEKIKKVNFEITINLLKDKPPYRIKKQLKANMPRIQKYFANENGKYSCPHCTQEFGQTAGLSRHIKKQHPSQTPTITIETTPLREVVQEASPSKSPIEALLDMLCPNRDDIVPPNPDDLPMPNKLIKIEITIEEPTSPYATKHWKKIKLEQWYNEQHEEIVKVVDAIVDEVVANHCEPEVVEVVEEAKSEPDEIVHVDDVVEEPVEERCEVSYDADLVKCCKTFEDGGFAKAFHMLVDVKKFNITKQEVKKKKNKKKQDDKKEYEYVVQSTGKPKTITLVGIKDMIEDELENTHIELCDAWLDYTKSTDYKKWLEHMKTDDYDEEKDGKLFDDDEDFLDVLGKLVNPNTIDSFLGL